jgi:hypothetical protein
MRSVETGFEAIATGYAGRDAGRNNPELQHVAGTGPIPAGRYTIGPAHNTPEHGPVTMRLIPDPKNEMFGRDGFLIHGDNKTGDASHGCIILNRVARLAVAASSDRYLIVIPG